MIYRERLWAPLSWWVIGFAFGVSFVTAIGWYLGVWVASAAGLLTTLGLSAVLLSWGHTTLSVDAGGVTARGARLEWPWLGEVGVLDAAATKARLGVDASAAAFVVQRPYIPTSVTLEVDDPADPHPYWLLSTRQPVAFAAAIAKARRAASEGQA